MDKTPGQVLYKRFAKNGPNWHELSDATRKGWEADAAAVIDHARPQIETKTRAVAVEECMAKVFPNKYFTPEEFKLFQELNALATAPAGMVCAPVEPEEWRLEAGNEACQIWGANAREIWRAMMEARPK